MAGTIKGITIEIGGNTTELVSALSKADKAIKETQKSLNGVQKALKLDPGNTKLLTEQQKLLADRVNETKERLNALKEAQKNLDASGVDKNSEQYRKLQTEIGKTEAELKHANKELKNFGSVGAQQIKQVGKSFEGIGGKLKQIGTTLTTTVTLPLAALGAQGVKSFAEVDKTMTLVNATMGTTAEEAKLLETAMKEAAANSTFGMNDAATATLNFARAGLDAEQAAAALAPAMNLAAAEGGDLDTVSGGLVATLNGFGDTFDNASKYADIFANACNNSALDVNGLSEAMSVAAPIFKTAGYSVEDAALYMGTMANAGIDANTAANALKTGMARLVEPAKEGAEWMEQLGIEVTNADGSMKDSIEVQKLLHDAFAGLSESEQIAAASAIFGKNQMSNWLALINTAPGEVGALSDALKTEGTVAGQADAMMSGFGGSLEKLKSSIDVAVTSLGQALAPVISAVAEKIQQAVDWFNSLSEEQQQQVVKIGLVVAAIGPLLTMLGGLISSIGTIMQIAPLIAGALNPVTIAIGLVVAAIVVWIKNWEDIKQLCIEICKMISDAFEAMGEAIVSGLKKLGDKMAEIWQKIKATVSNTMSNIKSAVSSAMETLKSNVSAALDKVRQFFSEKLEAAKTIVNNALNNIKQFFSTALENIKNAVSTAFETVKTTVSNALEAVKSFITEKLTAAKNTVVSILDGIKSGFSTALEAVKSVVSTVLEAVKGFFETHLTGAQNIVKNAMEAVGNTIKTVLDNAKSFVESVLSSIKGFFETHLGGLVDIVRNIFGGIFDAIKEKMDAAKKIIQDVIDTIKGLFSGEIKLNLKVPHITVSGGEAPWGIGGKGKLPSFDVKWYDQGGIFRNPTVIGVGERRPEFVGALDDLRQLIREESGGGMTNQLLTEMISLLSTMAGQGRNLIVNQTINAQNTSYAAQQREAAYTFKQIARAI